MSVLDFLKQPIKSVLAGKTAAVPAAGSSYYGTTTSRGYVFGPSAEHDPFSDRPFIDYRNPGDTNTTTDKTRVDTTFNPMEAAPQSRDSFYNPRLPVSASSKIRKTLGATSDQELDHNMPLALSGSNDRANLSMLDKSKNQAFGKLERSLQKDVLDGRLSLFQAQIKDAKNKGLPVPFTASPLAQYEKEGAAATEKANNENSISGILKNTFTGIPAVVKDVFSPKKASAAVEQQNPVDTFREKVLSTMPFTDAAKSTLRKIAIGLGDPSNRNAPSQTSYGKDNKPTNILINSIETPIDQQRLSHEFFNTIFSDQGINPTAFNAAWEKAKKENPYLNTIDDKELNNSSFSKVFQGKNGSENTKDPFYLATERFAFLGSTLGSDGISALPPSVRQFYNSSLSDFKDTSSALQKTEEYKTLDSLQSEGKSLDQQIKSITTRGKLIDAMSKKIDNTDQASIDEFNKKVKEYNLDAEQVQATIKDYNQKGLNRFADDIGGKIDYGSPFGETAHSTAPTIDPTDIEIKMPFSQEKVKSVLGEKLGPVFGQVEKGVSEFSERIVQTVADIYNQAVHGGVKDNAVLQKGNERVSDAFKEAADIQDVMIKNGWSEQEARANAALYGVSTIIADLVPFVSLGAKAALTATRFSPEVDSALFRLGLDKGNFSVSQWAKNTTTAADHIIQTGDREGFAQLIKDYKTIGEAVSSGNKFVPKGAARFIQEVAKKIEMPVAAEGARYNLVKPAEESLPGYRPQPGQSPAFGLSIQRVEPVGFGDEPRQSPLDFIKKPITEAAGEKTGPLPEGFRYVEPNEILKNGATTKVDLASGRQITNAPVTTTAPLAVLREEAKKYKSAAAFSATIKDLVMKKKSGIELLPNQKEFLEALSSPEVRALKPSELFNKLTSNISVISTQAVGEPTPVQSTLDFIKKPVAETVPPEAPRSSIREVLAKPVSEVINEAKTAEATTRPEPTVSIATKATSHIDETQLDSLAYKIKNREFTPEDIDQTRAHISIAAESLDENPAKELVKYAGPKGELGEVTGKGSSYWGKHGDQIASSLGFSSSEDARQAYLDFREQKNNLNDLRKYYKTMRDEQITVRKGEILMQKARGDRRARFRVLKERYQLNDSDLQDVRKGKDLTAMTDDEFAEFIARAEVHAEEIEKTKAARMQVEATINDKQLQKVENLQKAMKLPDLSEMTTEQLYDFDALLSQYQFRDEFLSQRKLETIDNTDLAGVKIYREAKVKFAEKLGVDPDKLNNLFSGTDKYRWDSSLAEKNPFYKLMVENFSASMIEGEARYLELEEMTNKLLGRSRKGTGMVNKVIPTDDRIFDYLTASPADKPRLAADMTPEEYAAAEFFRNEYNKALDYAYKHQVFRKSRYEDSYITNIRRDFLEAIKGERQRNMGVAGSILTAFKELISKYEEDFAVLNILDEKTGEILPLEKFFKFAMERKGNMVPTKNVAKAFLSYMKTFETKRALDRIVPELMTYVDIVTPRNFTPRGLELDDRLKSFVKQYINNKKGRKIWFGADQGSKFDGTMKVVKAFTSVMDLAINIPVQLGSHGGAQAAVYTSLGPKNWSKGWARLTSKKGKEIAKDYEAFTGRVPWKALFDASRGLLDKSKSLMFYGFQSANVAANKVFLLGSMTDEEYASGEITPQRQAELKTELGRWAPIEKSESLVGATTLGGLITQYKKWAIPPARTAIKNFRFIYDKIKSGDASFIKSKEFSELFRIAQISAMAALAAYFVSTKDDKKDKSFVNIVEQKLVQDLSSMLSSIDPATYTSAPRTATLAFNLMFALSDLVRFAQYDTSGKNFEKGDFKGVKKLEALVTPSIVKKLFSTNDKGAVKLLPPSNNKTSDKLPSLKGKLPKLPKFQLPKLPRIPKLKNLPPIN